MVPSARTASRGLLSRWELSLAWTTKDFEAQLEKGELAEKEN